MNFSWNGSIEVIYTRFWLAKHRIRILVTKLRVQWPWISIVRSFNLIAVWLSLILILFTVKPLDTLIITPNRPLVTGIRSELQCRSTGSRPPAQISWWKGNNRLSSSSSLSSNVLIRDSIINDGNTTFSTLSFIPSVDDDKQVISCRADNIQMHGDPLDDSRILNVQCKH